MDLISTRRAQCARVAAVVATLVFVLLSQAGPAHAHAIVESTIPEIGEVVDQSPDLITMRFNEPVEIAFGAVRVFDTSGQRVDDGETEHEPGRSDAIQVGLEPDLPDGTYTVTWRVVSADSHAIEEAFVFHVGAPGERSEGIGAEIIGGEGGGERSIAFLFGVVRWLMFLALIVLVGAAIFWAVVWRRPSIRPAAVESSFARRFRRLVITAWATLVVASVLSVVFQGAIAGGLPLWEAARPSVLVEVMDTRYGVVAIVKIVALAMLAGMWVLRERLDPAGTIEARQRLSVGAAGAGGSLPVPFAIGAAVPIALLVAAPGLAGHAGSTDPVAVNVAVDALHVAGASAWLGGLVCLLFGAFPSVRSMDDIERTTTLSPIVVRYSNMATIAVGVITLSGLWAAWIEVRALRALTTTDYGVVLLTKVAIFLPLVALGAINNRIIKPRIQAAAATAVTAHAPLARLRRFVLTEIALGAAVLAVTALLVNIPPARVDAGIDGPFVTDIALGGSRLEVLVDPNSVGRNAIHLTAQDPSGAPARIKEMRVLFRMPARDIGPLVAKGRRLAPGHFIVEGHQLSVPGEWTLELVARTGRFDEERATVQIEVND